MICIIAGNYLEASRFAYAQQLDKSEWFYPEDEQDLLKRSNFHVIVTGTAGMNTPASYFDKIFELAKSRGRINRS